MTRIFLLAAAPLALMGCVETSGTASVGMTMSQKNALFDQAVASIGCDLRFESDYAPVELQTGMTREEIQQVAATKVRRGQAAAMADGGVRLTSGPCAEGATPVAAAPAPAAAAS